MSVLFAALVALVVVTLVGAAVLSLTRPAVQRRLLPAAPALGAGALVVALHWTGLVVGTRVGAWIVVGAAVVVLAVQLLRRKVDIRGLGRPAVFLGILAAIGLLGAILVWLPMIRNGVDVFVQANASNDAFYYVATAHWFMDHTLLVSPHLGSAPASGISAPLYGPPAESLRIGLRLGQELSQAAFASITGVDSADGFMPWLGTWIIAMPGAVWAFGRGLGLRWPHIVVLAAVYVSSFSLISQTLAQNADSLLGVMFVPLLIGLVVAGVRPRGVAGSLPLWIPALALTALVGTYTEYAPFIGPVLAAVVLVRARHGYGRAVLRAAGLIVLAVVFNPLIWARAAQSFVVTGAVASQGGSPDSSLGGRLLGLLGPWAISVRRALFSPVSLAVSVAMLIALILVVIGIVLGLRALRTRGMAVGVLAAMSVALYLALRSTPYVVHRASDMVVPLMLLGAGAGWSVYLRDWPAVSGSGRRRRVLAALAVLGVVEILGINAAASARAGAVTVAQANIVGDDFAAVEGWVKKYGGPEGDRISVAAPVLFDQLWLTSRLGDHPEVSYISLRGDLGYRDDLSLHSFWNGEIDPYIVVGPGAFFDGGGAVVDRHGRFTLLDTRKAPVTIAVPMSGETGWSSVTGKSGTIWGPEKGEVVILSNRRAPLPNALSARVLKGNAPVSLKSQSGATIASAVPGRSRKVILGLGSVSLTDGVGRAYFELHGRTAVGLTGILSTTQ